MAQQFKIDLGDGRKLVAHSYFEESIYKEVWIEVENTDGSLVPIAIVGCHAGIPIHEFTARLWTRKDATDGTDYDKEIHIESMEVEYDD